MTSGEFEKFLFEVAMRHIDDSDWQSRTDLEIRDDGGMDINYALMHVMEIKEMLIDMYERAYEIGHDTGFKDGQTYEREEVKGRENENEIYGIPG